MNMRPYFPLLLVSLLAACATPEPPPSPKPPEVSVPETPVPQETKPELQNAPLKHLANRNLKPIEERPLNAKAGCAFRDPNGYRGKLQLDVKEASVKRFTASVDVPKQGTCNFDMKNFRQTDSLPIVVLAARQGNCKVRMWEQESKVTVAFHDCRKECTGNSVEYLWPILVDNQKGGCS